LTSALGGLDGALAWRWPWNGALAWRWPWNGAGEVPWGDGSAYDGAGEVPWGDGSAYDGAGKVGADHEEVLCFSLEPQKVVAI